MELNICHLYNNVLNQCGDRSNIIALEKRCVWRNIDINLFNVSIGDAFLPEQYDIVFWGGAQEYNNKFLYYDVMNTKANAIRESIEKGKVFLCVSGGYQLLGKYFKTINGEKIECVGALDLWTVENDTRMTGNTVFECGLIRSASFDGKIVGFENHAGKTYLCENVKPLGKIIKGYGNNGEDMCEGAVYKNVFCSYSQGSLLPNNPVFADFIIQKALMNKYPDFQKLTPLDDQFEIMARHNMLI